MSERAVIYARQSTSKQQSIPAQISALEEFAEGRNIKVVAIFEDVMSGKDTNRDGFTAMKNYIAEHPIDIILVWRFDRLSRNLKDFHQFLSGCEKVNVSVFSLNEQLSNDKFGRSDNTFLLQLLGAAAEYQKSVMKENQQIAYLSKHQQGKIISPNVSYGYGLEGDELQINDQEAKIVREIFRLYVEKGIGYKTIAEYLVQ